MVFNKYPYTDFHELNLDWILKEMQSLQEQMDGLLEKAIEEATKAAKEYVDEQLAGVMEQFATLQRNFNELNLNVIELNNQFQRFTANINAQINALKQYIDDSLTAQTLQTQLLIAQNNEYILSELETYLTQIKVINYFTGEKVSIQDMFNYLAGLHLSDAIDYDTMALRALTYSYLAGLNINYTNLAMHGNTLYI